MHAVRLRSAISAEERTGLLYLLIHSFGIDHFLKHVDHIVELSVDVADDDDWLLHSQHV